MLGLGLGLPMVALSAIRSVIASLWPTGTEPGLWYDQPDLASGYQDSVGATALYQPGAGSIDPPVGLRLDKRLGLVRGPTLVTNGTFSANTAGWTPTLATQAAVAGELELTGTSANGYSETTITTVIGKAYIATVTARAGTSSLAKFGLTGTAILASTASTTNTTLQFIFVATAASHVPYVQVGTAGTAYFDNVLVQLLDGNHSTQATAAARPVVTGRMNLLDATDGAVTTYPTRQSVIAASTPISGHSNSVYFNDDTVDAYAYKAAAHTNGLTYTLSVFVQMDDGLAPVPGGNDAASDFALVLFGNPYNSGVSVSQFNGAIYRVSVSGASSGATTNFGVVKYSANTARKFRVAGYQVTLGAAMGTYQRVNTPTDYDASVAPLAEKFDGGDDGYSTATVAAGQIGGALTDVFFNVKRLTAARSVFGHFGAIFFAAADSAGGAALACDAAASTGTLAYYVDGVLVGGPATTRVQLDAALTVGVWHVLEVRNVNLSAWTSFAFGNYGGGFNVVGLNNNTVICPAQTDAMRGQIRRALAAKVGATVV